MNFALRAPAQFMRATLCAVALLCALLFSASAEVLDADLLIVGGNEPACAAAVQAARLGGKRNEIVRFEKIPLALAAE